MSDNPVTSDLAKRYSERFKLAVELHEAGVAMMKQNLRRRYPHAADEELRARLQAWLFERPGAELGDGYGNPIDLVVEPP